MKRTALFFFALIAVSSLLYGGQKSPGAEKGVTTHNGFLKARDFLALTPGNQRLYVMGLLDGWYMAPMFGGPENYKNLMGIEKCVEGMKASQVAAIIEKYVNDHAEKWDWDLKDAGFNAVLDACRNR